MAGLNLVRIEIDDQKMAPLFVHAGVIDAFLAAQLTLQLQYTILVEGFVDVDHDIAEVHGHLLPALRVDGLLGHPLNR
jgi:hypothetical protein